MLLTREGARVSIEWSTYLLIKSELGICMWAQNTWHLCYNILFALLRWGPALYYFHCVTESSRSWLAEIHLKHSIEGGCTTGRPGPTSLTGTKVIFLDGLFPPPPHSLDILPLDSTLVDLDCWPDRVTDKVYLDCWLDRVTQTFVAEASQFFIILSFSGHKCHLLFLLSMKYPQWNS